MSIPQVVPKIGDASLPVAVTRRDSRHTPLWYTASGWVLVLPMLFYAANGALEARTAPAAFRFTATQEDSSIHRAVQALIGLIICSFVLSKFRSVMTLVRRNPTLCLLPLCAIASAFWSEVPQQTLVNSFYLSLLTIFALFISAHLSPRERLELIVMTGATALFLSLIFVAFFPSVGIDAYQNNAWKGMFIQRNVAATAAVVFGTSAAYYEAKVLADAAVKWFVIAASALFVVMAGSVTGWELALVACGLGTSIAFLSRFKHREALLLSVVCLISAVAFAGVLYQYRDVILAAVGKDPTLDQRTMIWSITLKSAALHPWLGYGYTAFWRNLNGPSETAILTTGWMEAQAQSGYIDLVLSLGLIGIAAFVITIADPLRRAWRRFRAMETTSAFTRWSIVIAVVILAYNIGESSIAWCYNMTWLVFLLALIGVGEQTVRPESKRKRSVIWTSFYK